MSMLRFVIFVLCLVVLECSSAVRADDMGCYTSGSVAGIVIAAVVVTLVMGGLAAAFIWYLWKQRKESSLPRGSVHKTKECCGDDGDYRSFSFGYGDTKSMDKPIVCPPMSPDKQMIARETNDYAFDNPYFKDDETDTANPDAAEKGESGFRTDNGDVTTSPNAKPSNGTTANHHKKSRPFSSLPFHAVFHPSGKKQQRATMDDTYISKHLERITVPLRGHDFTGLGFNICGNMRDGIFVKDVLHRGPASESGKIKAGDRIVGVTVSFAAMVYEDALTILSYASPYDVRLEIEKAPATATVSLPSCSPKRLGASTSFRNNEQRRLFHPLYRSQSIDDLTQIGKDGFGLINNSGSQRDSSASATPKRSQSVEASNGGLKSRPAFTIKAEENKSSNSKGSRKSSTSSSSCESTAKAVTPTEKSLPVTELPKEEICTKKDVKSARFRVDQVNVKAEAPSKTVPPVKPARESHEDKHQLGNDVAEKVSEVVTNVESMVSAAGTSKPNLTPTEGQSVPESEFNASVKPTAPPRKSNSTPKRRAPAPPPTTSAKAETSAVIHQSEDLQKQKNEEAPSHNASEISPSPAVHEISSETNGNISVPTEKFTVTHELQITTNDLPVFSSVEKMTDPGIGSSDTSSLASGDNSSTKMDKDDQNSSPGKRKASSLGDLTKLDHGATKKTSISSAILERAVSLDLQQSIPGENLTRHKKILRAPAFEDDYLEDREDLSELNGQGLKRWDDGLDKVFVRLPNGDAKLDDDLKNEEDDLKEPISTVEIKSVEINYLVEKPNESENKTNSKEPENDEKLEKISSESEKEPQNNHIEISVGSDMNHSEIYNFDAEPVIIDSSTEKSASELEDDSPVGELPLPTHQNSSTTLVTSTPVKKIIEVKNLILDDDDDDEDDDKLDDVPYLASSSKYQNRDEYTTKFTTKTNNTSTTHFSPVTISIPVIKPDLTQFEKLPSPPPSSTHPGIEPSWRMTKTSSTDENGKTSLEKITVQSLYKPIFTSKEINSIDEPIHQNCTEKMVNGIESDTSEHYSTAQENTSTSSLETSSVSVTLSNPVTKDVTKTPNTIAGFAKTLIIPSPNDVENLLSLAAEPNTPPPILESHSKPVGKE